MEGEHGNPKCEIMEEVRESCVWWWLRHVKKKLNDREVLVERRDQHSAWDKLCWNGRAEGSDAPSNLELPALDAGRRELSCRV